MTRRPRLSASMTLTQFDHGYWYATELKQFATDLGIPSVAKLRKDELEHAIRQFLRSGTNRSAAKAKAVGIGDCTRTRRRPRAASRSSRRSLHERCGDESVSGARGEEARARLSAAVRCALPIESVEGTNSWTKESRSHIEMWSRNTFASANPRSDSRAYRTVDTSTS